MNIIKKSLILNVAIAVLVTVGLIILFFTKVSATGLSADGLDNFKFYTTLSNTLAGAVALCQLIMWSRGKGYLKVLKLTTAMAVTVTFLVIACFLGPLYGMLKMYRGSNFFFHLTVPIVCVAEFILSGAGRELTLKHCMIASLFSVIYGAAYLINIFINGIGEWPESNDWYGFLNWGWGTGFVIYAGIVLISFGVACLLRELSRKVGTA